jgi:flagellar protein FlaG
MTTIPSSTAFAPQPSLPAAAAPAPAPNRQAAPAPASPTAATSQMADKAAEASVGMQAARQAVAKQTAQQQAAKVQREPVFDAREMQKRLEQAIAKLNDQMQQTQRRLGFSVDQETDRIMVRVMNKETGELVRELSPEAVVRMADAVGPIKGGLFDEQL